MASTEPLTGATIYDNDDAALGGQQIGDAVTDLAPFTVPRFSTTGARDTAFAAWDAAGGTMTSGLLCTVAGRLYRYTGSAWEDVQAGDKRQRQWTFDRSGAASDNPVGTGFIVVQSDTIASAPAGDYAITARLVIANTTAIAGFQRTLANGTSITTVDPRADTIAADYRHTFVQAGGYQHSGGSLTVAQYYSASGGDFTVWSQGTQLTIYYLGPR